MRALMNTLDRWWVNPKFLLYLAMTYLAISVAFLGAAWDTDTWRGVVVFVAIALVSLVAGAHVSARLERFFSPRPVLWVTKQERQLLLDIAAHKACGAPYLRDGKLYVCQVPPHTDGVNHIGIEMFGFDLGIAQEDK